MKKRIAVFSEVKVLSNMKNNPKCIASENTIPKKEAWCIILGSRGILYGNYALK